MQTIETVDSLNAGTFLAEIVPSAKPLVIRGLVRDWPLVAESARSDQAFCDYLKRFDRGFELRTVFGQPSINGRQFYNEDLSGMNFQVAQSRLSVALDYLLEHAEARPAPLLAIQSIIMSRYLPGLEQENRLPDGYVPDGVDGRIWLGGRATIAAHFDPSENIACCVAGERQFTIFPPEQVGNLYVGPFELTPAGASISMVDFDQPDLELHPNFREAEAAAYQVVLQPGDAIYIPYLWWHHVRSRDAVNGLVNYWWARAPERSADARNVLLHAMLTIRSLPPTYRDAWRSMFEHYVFGDVEVSGAHLPEERRGILGDIEPEEVARIRKALSQALGRN